MKITIETRPDNTYVVSNAINNIVIKSLNDYYLLSGCGIVKKIPSRDAAFGEAFNILSNNNVIDVDGLLRYMSLQNDIDDNYKATICNLIAYGIRHECLAPNQFVDWLVNILANINVSEIVRFTNDYWLSPDYICLKERQSFYIDAWVLSDEIWPETVGHVDMGYRENLSRGYRIEVSDMTGTRWLPIDLVDDDNVVAYFNNEEHLEFYEANGYTPTGRISFMGYFRAIGDEYVPID